MNCLVTGGAGFIGSHLCERLLEEGHTVYVVDDLSTGRLENIAPLLDHERFHFTEGTIFDEGLVRFLVGQCEEIYHLAAAVGVKLIVQRPIHTIETNVHGTDLILKAAREKGGSQPMPRLLIASSSEVYGKGAGRALREDDDMVLGPTTHSRWCYACSKAVDEFLALAYHAQHGLPVTVARFFNTVGPRQVGQYGMVLPRFVQQALAGEPITVYDDGRMVRCFCHVDDVAGAIRKLVRHAAAAGQVVNVGSDEPVSILELAERVKAAAGSGSPIRMVPYEKAYASGFEDIRHRVPDIGKAGALIGYRPSRSLDEIIASVIDYYRREDR